MTIWNEPVECLLNTSLLLSEHLLDSSLHFAFLFIISSFNPLKITIIEKETASLWHELTLVLIELRFVDNTLEALRCSDVKGIKKQFKIVSQKAERS